MPAIDHFYLPGIFDILFQKFLFKTSTIKFCCLNENFGSISKYAIYFNTETYVEGS